MHYKPTTIREYIENKLEMLETEFCLKLTEAEKGHMFTLKTTLQIDNYAHKLWMDKL